MVLCDGVFDKFIDLGKGVLGHDIDGLESIWERGRCLRSRSSVVRSVWRRLRRRSVQVESGGQRWERGGSLGFKVPWQAGEDEDEQNETVLPAVVGKRELLKTVAMRGR